MQNNMTPEQIKNALRNRGISQSGLARDMKCTPQHVYCVIKDPTRSYPVACHVAKALMKKPEEVWPETFGPDPEQPKIGRPLTKGLFDIEREAAVA